MMLGMLISALCVNVAEPNYRNACEKAMVAGTMQYGLYQDAEKLQRFVTDYASKKAVAVTGRTVWGIAAVVYTAQTKKEFLYSFKAKPVSDNMTVNLGVGMENPKGTVTLRWSF